MTLFNFVARINYELLIIFQPNQNKIDGKQKVRDEGREKSRGSYKLNVFYSVREIKPKKREYLFKVDGRFLFFMRLFHQLLRPTMKSNWVL